MLRHFPASRDRASGEGPGADVPQAARGRALHAEAARAGGPLTPRPPHPLTLSGAPRALAQ